MSETPEAAYGRDGYYVPESVDLASVWEVLDFAKHETAFDTRDAERALASLRQRQEERDEFYQALLREQASESERDIASLRTQLQQAEQERDRARRVFIEEIEQLESQLQQAETALASLREAAERTLQDIHNGEANSTGAGMLAAALAAPPPNTKDGPTRVAPSGESEDAVATDKPVAESDVQRGGTAAENRNAASVQLPEGR